LVALVLIPVLGRAWLHPALVRGPVTIALFGVDAGGKRADMIQVLWFNLHAEQPRVAALQMPRDTLVRIGGRLRRINSVYSLGPERLVGLLEGLISTDLQRTVTLTFDTAAALVDALLPQGVPVHIDRAVRYLDRAGGLDIHFQKGWHRLHGQDLVKLVRFRGPAGDVFDRLPRQQEVFRALWHELKKHPPGFRSLWKLRRLWGQIDTTLSFREAATLLWAGRKMQPEDVAFYLAAGYVSGPAWRLDKRRLAGQLREVALHLSRQTPIPVRLVASSPKAAAAAERRLRRAVPQAVIRGTQVRPEANGPASFVVCPPGRRAEAKTLLKSLRLDPHRVHARRAPEFEVVLGQDFRI